MKYKQTEYDELVKPYFDEFRKSLDEFVSIDSQYDESTVDKDNPFGKGVTRALNYIYDLAKKDGFKVTNYDNMVVEILCGEGNKNITILAHADVVPEGKGWNQDPFKVKEENGVLTGRGVSDDKGPLLQTYYALKALRDHDMLGNYLIRFIVGGNEESGSRGVIHYFEDLKKEESTLGFSPDAEYPLIYAEKGIRNFLIKGQLHLDNVLSIHGGLASNSVLEECVLRIKNRDDKLIDLFKNEIKDLNIQPNHDGSYSLFVRGKSAHGSTPELGVNAGILVLNVLNKYYDSKELKHILDCFSDVYGRGIDAYDQSVNMDNQQTSMNVGILDFDGKEIKLVINYRYLDTTDIEEVTKKIINKVSPLEVDVVADAPLLFYPKDHPLIQTLLKAYQEETGDYQTPIKAIGGGTYAKETNNCVAFGAEFPLWDSKMHGVGEGSRLDDIYKSMAIYARAIKELGNLLEKDEN